jgi:hypothetical protein
MPEKIAILELQMEHHHLHVPCCADGRDVVMALLTVLLLIEQRKVVMIQTLLMEMVVHLFANLNVVMVLSLVKSNVIWELKMPMLQTNAN